MRGFTLPRIARTLHLQSSKHIVSRKTYFWLIGCITLTGILVHGESNKALKTFQTPTTLEESLQRESNAAIDRSIK